MLRVAALWSLILAFCTNVQLNVGIKSSVSNTLAIIARSLGGDTVSNNPDDVRFYLFSNPSNTSQAQEILFGNQECLEASSFDCDNISKILVHGFTQNGLMEEGFPADVKIEYLKQFRVTGNNIITVDWGKLATCTNPSSILCCPNAVDNVKVADLVHLVGHSLGAHVSGYAGKVVINATKCKIGRITGLDPAGPSFDSLDTLARKMTPSDAKFTDIYHTCAGALGTTLILGQLDVFVNGGAPPQPGCQNVNDVQMAICSHERSNEYHAKSIALGDPATNSDASICACKLENASVIPSAGCCDRKLVYGEYCEPGTAGTYSAQYPPP